MKTNIKIKAATIAIFALITSAHAQFTPGNLVVLQVGNGGTLNSAAAPLFLDQFTTATAGQTVTPFITIASDGTGLVLSGSATSEGSLTRSTDGSILTFGGYSAASGTASVASGTALREVGVVNASGQFSIAANSSSALSGNNIRGVVSDGQNYWIAGANGIYYQASGSGSLVQVTNSNSRVVNIFNGNLEYSTGSGANHAVLAFTGTPTSLTASSLFIGSGSAASPYDFFLSGTTAYVADDTASAAGGIQRWDFNGSAWVLSYTIGTGAASIGARQLTVDTTTAGGATIYATTAEGAANRLISVQDLGSAAADAATLITLATAPAGELFRGVDFAPTPEPSTLALAGIGLAALWNFRRRKS
jgi:hypothetical protein